MTRGEKTCRTLTSRFGESYYANIGRIGGSRPKPKGFQVLTPEQVREIHTRWVLGNVSKRQLAQDYEVSPDTIRRAIEGIRQKGLTGRLTSGYSK